MLCNYFKKNIPEKILTQVYDTRILQCSHYTHISDRDIIRETKYYETT